MKWKCNDFKCIRKLTMHQANKSSGWAEFFLYNWNNYVAISRCNINCRFAICYLCRYKRAEIQPDRTVIYTHTDATGYAISSFAKAFIDSRYCWNLLNTCARSKFIITPVSQVTLKIFCNFVCRKFVTLGVIGVDVPHSSLYDFLRTQFEPCRSPASEWVLELHLQLVQGMW